MHNTPRKNDANKRLSIHLLLYTCFLICTLMLASGCEEAAKTPDSQKLTQTADANGLVLEAYRVLIQSLADPNPAVRVNAIEAVVQTKRIKLMPRVRRLLNDEFAPVRFAAAVAVGDMDYSFAKKAVTGLFADPDSNVKLAACYALIRLGSEKYREVLRRAIGSSDQTVRANAAFLLGKSDDTEAVKLLYWAMQNKNSEDKVIFQAAESLAMLQDDRIYPKLWTMLIAAHADVRVVGVRAMGTLNTREAKNALLTMLDDGVLEIRLAAAEQLGRKADRTGQPEVLDVFTRNLTAGTDEPGRQRVYVLTALAIGRIGTPALTRYLPRLIRDQSKAVQIAAAQAVLLTNTGS